MRPGWPRSASTWCAWGSSGRAWSPAPWSQQSSCAPRAHPVPRPVQRGGGCGLSGQGGPDGGAAGEISHLHPPRHARGRLQLRVRGREGAGPGRVQRQPSRPHPARAVVEYIQRPGTDLRGQALLDQRCRGGPAGRVHPVWKTVAAYFSANPWVVGFDPINEPFTKTLLPGKTEVAARLECLYTGPALPAAAPLMARCCPAGPRPDYGADPDPAGGGPGQVGLLRAGHLPASGPPQRSRAHGLQRPVYNFHDYCGLRSGVTGNPTDLAACADQELRTIQRRSEERPDIARSSSPRDRPGS